jgi:cytochrome c oxidase subunit 3
MESVSGQDDIQRDRIARVGMTIFLGSWVVMFASLFFGYAVLRMRAPAWPPPMTPELPVVPAFLNSILLLASSFTLSKAVPAARRGNHATFRNAMLETLLCGSFFLGNQIWLWSRVWDAGLRISSGVYGSVFYTLTVFHAVHVAVGIGLLAWLLATGRRKSALDWLRSAEMTEWYWHFVGIIWVVMFITVYVI